MVLRNVGGPGSVVGTEKLPPFAFLSEVTTSQKEAWRILFESKDSQGDQITATTSLIVPVEPTNPQKLISLQYPADSNVLSCQPSAILAEAPASTVSDRAIAKWIGIFLDLGYYVAVPDHEGPKAAYGDGRLAGQIILDGIRAVHQASDVTEMSPSSNVALWGYSNAGAVTEWAAELRKDYAPDVTISAVAIGGITTRVVKHFDDVNNGPFAGFIPLFCVGLAKHNPSFAAWLDAALIPSTAVDFLHNAGEGSLPAVLTFFGGRDVYAYFTAGAAISRDPALLAAFDLADAAGAAGVPDMPILYYHAVHDWNRAVGDLDAVVSTFRAAGARVRYLRNAACGHVSEGIRGTAEAVRFLRDGLQGDEAYETVELETTALAEFAEELLGEEACAFLTALLGEALAAGA